MLNEITKCVKDSNCYALYKNHTVEKESLNPYQSCLESFVMVAMEFIITNDRGRYVKLHALQKKGIQRRSTFVDRERDNKTLLS